MLFTMELTPDKRTFSEIDAYLRKVLVIDKDYNFDDEQTEIVYKRLKGLHFPKEKFDRIPFIVFSYIFDHDILNQIRARATLFEMVLERFKMKDYLSHEIFLNLAYLIYIKFHSIEYLKVIPSILMNFFNEELITKVLILEI